MKFNNKELTKIYFGPADIEGRLHHKRADKSGFKERWFKLRYNLLFYHNIDEMGQINQMHPTGVIILENYNVNLDIGRESYFAFSIAFKNEHHKRHILSGQSKSSVEHWINAIKQASYGYWRSQLILLQQILCEKTGNDPLLMYPRNKGVVRDEAWEYKSSFRSHIKSFTSSAATSTLEFVKNEENLFDII